MIQVPYLLLLAFLRDLVALVVMLVQFFLLARTDWLAYRLRDFPPSEDDGI
jgi:hypothetical protein